MKVSLKHSTLVAALLITFTACGSGGGGSSQVSTPNNNTSSESSNTNSENSTGFENTGNSNNSSSNNNTENSTTSKADFIVLYSDGIKSTNQVSVNNGEYSFTRNGHTISLNTPVMMAGKLLDLTDSKTSRKVIGGSTYSYSRFGAIVSGQYLTQTEMFYVGEKTTNMPTKGTATYSGLVIDHNLTSDDVKFNVNFADKTISGTSSNLTFTDGKITGADFKGDVSGNGTFNGSFFGDAAAELGGVGTSNGKGFSFGAKK